MSALRFPDCSSYRVEHNQHVSDGRALRLAVAHEDHLRMPYRNPVSWWCDIPDASEPSASVEVVASVYVVRGFEGPF